MLQGTQWWALLNCILLFFARVPGRQTKSADFVSRCDEFHVIAMAGGTCRPAAALLGGGQVPARTAACGNGPSAFSVRIESQYSRISLILPSSIRNTRQ